MSLRGSVTFDRSIKADGDNGSGAGSGSPPRGLLLRQRDAPALATLRQ